MKGIVERAKVRVDLFGNVPGKEPQLLACLDGRACEDNPFDFLFCQRGDGHGHGKVRLSSSCWTDTDDEIVLADGVDVLFLGEAFWGNDPLSRGDEDRIKK